MKRLDEIIEKSKEVREVKRALAVKMVLGGMPGKQVAETLKVSEQFISKWKGVFEREGAEGLRLAYQGSLGFLTKEQREEVIEWIKAKGTISLEPLISHLARVYEVSYGSKQSLYELLNEAGMSWHKSEKVNPKRDKALVMERRESIKKSYWSMKRL
jgi:putative transposase